MIKIESNADDVARLFDQIGKKIFPTVERQSINDAARQTTTRIRREVSQRTGVPVKVLRKRMKLHQKSNRNKGARIFVGTQPVSAFDLSAKVVKRGGVSWRGSGGRTTNKSAFIARTRFGTSVFVRRGASRGPLDKQSVPISTHARAAATQALPFYKDKLKTSFANKFSFQMDREIAKKASLRVL